MVAFSSKRVFSIFVGINEYRDRRFPKLKGAKSDSLLYAEVFRDGQESDKDSSEKVVLVDEQATTQNILEALERISRQSKADDLFVFSYSGHGDSLGNEGRFHLLTYESDYKNQAQTGISSTTLREYFRRIRAKTKLVILDACRSVNGFEDSTFAFLENDQNLRNLNGEDVLFIGTDRLAMEMPFTDKDGKVRIQGVISRVVLDALKGNADINRDFVISSKELEAFVYKAMFDEIYRNPGLSYSPRTISRGIEFEICTVPRESVSNGKTESQTNTKASNADLNKAASSAPDERTVVSGENTEAPSKVPEWNGTSQAVLFANDVYDNTNAWRTLKNPLNDVNAIATELRTRYGFNDVRVFHNLTTLEIYDEIENLKKRSLNNDQEDQLFVFFAGHGISDANGKAGYYAGKDSPAASVDYRNSNRFVSLNGIMTAFDDLKFAHVMVMFDACYAGKIWEPATVLRKQVGELRQSRRESFFQNAGFVRNNVAESFPFGNLLSANTAVTLDHLNKLQYAKRIMKNRSRVVVTSGNRPVADWFTKKDGTRSENSPFAAAFLEALRTNGGPDEVLTAADYKPFIDKLAVEPTIGNLEGSDGDFAFIRR